MKKIVLFPLIFLAFSAFSQDNIVIKVVAAGVPETATGDNTDYSSGHSPFIYSTTTNGSTIDFDFDVTNTTGADVSWRVTRFNEADVPSDWSSRNCFGANCFLINSANPWCSPDNIVTPPKVNRLEIANGATANMSFHVITGSQGSGTYKLYLGNDCNTYADSVEIQVNFSVGIDEINPFSQEIKISPNPVNDVFSFQLPNHLITGFSIMNIVGKTLYTGENEGSADINLSDLPNGIYYLLVKTETGGILSRKFMVNH